MYVKSLAKKLVVSVSKIRKLAMVFLFVEIQKLLLFGVRISELLKEVLNLQSFAIKLAVSISVIRKLAVVFIPVEIQKFV